MSRNVGRPGLEDTDESSSSAKPRINVRFTPNQFDWLTQEASRQKSTEAAIVRNLVEMKREAPQYQDASSDPASLEHLRSDLRNDIRELFTDVFHSVPVSVDRVRRGKLQDLADQLGFASVEDFLQTMAFQAIEHPKSAASFLFAEIEESAIIAAQTEDHRSKNRKPKTSHKAA